MITLAPISTPTAAAPRPSSPIPASNVAPETGASSVNFSPLIKIMDNSNTALWTSQNFELGNFVKFCYEIPKILSTFSSSLGPDLGAPKGAL